MQLANHAPVADSQPVTIPSLKPSDVVVPGVGIGGNLCNLLHNSLLPVHRKPGENPCEGFCGHDRIHNPIVTKGNIACQAYNVTEIARTFTGVNQ